MQRVCNKAQLAACTRHSVGQIAQLSGSAARFLGLEAVGPRRSLDDQGVVLNRVQKLRVRERKGFIAVGVFGGECDAGARDLQTPVTAPQPVLMHDLQGAFCQWSRSGGGTE